MTNLFNDGAKAYSGLYLAVNSIGVVAVCDNQTTALVAAGMGSPDLTIVKKINTLEDGDQLTRAFFHLVTAAQICPPNAFESWNKLNRAGLKPVITRINSAKIYKPFEVATITLGTDEINAELKKISS